MLAKVVDLEVGGFVGEQLLGLGQQVGVVIGSCCLCRIHMEAEESCADAASTLYGSLFSSLCGSSKAGS